MLRKLSQASSDSLLPTRFINYAESKRLSSGGPHLPPWGPVSALDEWVAKEARPISIRQLMVFGRFLSEPRLIRSANYVRTELPRRLAHRIRDIQTLPYVVVTNPYMSQVFELYYKAFETLRRVQEIKNLEGNKFFCETIRETLDEHLEVIPKLAMGILECRDLMKQQDLDVFMNTILRSRISRRVIAEQHIALTQTFNLRQRPTFPTTQSRSDAVGEVFPKCNVSTLIQRCMAVVSAICSASYGPSVTLPKVQIKGHVTATFPYILTHLEYVIGELLRNSIQATVEAHKFEEEPPPIEVTICETHLHVTIRVSDRGGGIDPDVHSHLWSFSKGARSIQIMDNLSRVPRMAATLQELRISTHWEKMKPLNPTGSIPTPSLKSIYEDGNTLDLGSLSNLSERPANLRLGMGLPLSRVYAEYWAGSLDLHSLDGYGTDVFLGISKLGNRNEQVSTRARMDAL